MFYKDERLALFIDGSNLYAAAKALGFDIDYKLLRQEFMRRGKLLRAFYYTALLENDEYSPIRPLVDWLHYNGFTMVTKPAKEYTDSMGRRKVKGNMDIELTVDAMELAPRVDHIVLFSGDGDFRPLIASLQRQGVRVSVVSTIRSQPPMISDELRRQADNFIELEELKDVIGRPPANKAIPARCRPQAADTDLLPKTTRFGHGRHSPQQCYSLTAGFCLRSTRAI
ncbi:NYN domain-containing protein [Phaeobacter sp. BS34]